MSAVSRKLAEPAAPPDGRPRRALPPARALHLGGVGIHGEHRPVDSGPPVALSGDLLFTGELVGDFPVLDGRGKQYVVATSGARRSLGGRRQARLPRATIRQDSWDDCHCWHFPWV